MSVKTEETLLERAKVEEKNYNWVEAAKLYEQATKLYLNKKLVEKAAEGYKKVGYAYSRGLRQQKQLIGQENP